MGNYLSVVGEFEKCRDEVEKASLTWLLSSTSHLLLLNPEYLSAWNLRKQAIKRHGLGADVLRKELEFSLATIRTNPKSYAAWYHRRWLMTELIVEEQQDGIIAKGEIELCNKLLDLDARNCKLSFPFYFALVHGWNYRCFLLERFGLSVKAELDYTGLKIYQNFSNYSAWHRRTQLIGMLSEAEEAQAIMEADYELVKAAYFTEPADQSAWFYLRWLISQSSKKDCQKVIMAREMANIEELLGLEPEAPLALWTWCWLAEQLGVDSTERRALLQRVDPLRRGLHTS